MAEKKMVHAFFGGEEVPHAASFESVKNEEGVTLNATVAGIQSQIDHIVAGNTKLAVSSSLGDFFEGESHPVTITAKLSSGTGTIKIYRGTYPSGTLLRTSEGKVSQLTFSEDIKTTTSYYAVAEVTGGTVKGNAAGAHAYHPIYIGAGATASAVAEVPGNKQPVKSTPAGTYAIHVNEDEYVFMVVPNNMSIKNVIMDNQQFLYKQMANETINGVSYKVYRSTNSFSACDIEIVIS